MAANHQWTRDDIPDLSGKTAIVTGANSGLGFYTTLGLASKQAQVILACRDVEKGEQAAGRIRAEYPAASLAVMRLDLADLASIHSFADTFIKTYQDLHILCNNAGMMAIPLRRTADGFEMQFGTNHLGHFALTGLLLERLLQADEGRVVTVSSSAHRAGRIDFDNLNAEQSYHKWASYGQSKLANLLFAYELQRKFEANGAQVISLAAHPGYAATNLQSRGPRMAGSTLMGWVMRLSNRLLAQSPEMGALPSLYAATAPAAQGGDFVGPDGFMGQQGYPTKVHSSQRSYNEDTARRLWAVSEELTGVHYYLQS
jgi:NAD(P)-dependent dehydrogenase (short-subunit alcohol dehydrogenase family)